MDTLKVGMRDEMVWEVTEDLATSRGDYKVFSTPGMTRFVEMTAHKLVGPHLKPGQGQVGLQVNIRHMAPTPIGKPVRCEVELVAIDRRKLRAHNMVKRAMRCHDFGSGLEENPAA